MTKEALVQILSQDPRPAYQQDKDRVYKMDYGKYNISFSVDGTVLTVLSAEIKETEKNL